MSKNKKTDLRIVGTEKKSVSNSAPTCISKSMGTKKNPKDEYYTPPILVEPIFDYIKPNSTIWCPFDTEHSEFVIKAKELGHKVIYSHISLGQDFFEYEPDEDYDYIISNMPFSAKKEVLKRLYDIGKPFAMILNTESLNYQDVGEIFVDEAHPLQLLIPDKKVSYDGNTSSFNSSYFCNGVLPRDLIFRHLEHNNTRKNFVGSRMILDFPKEEERAVA